MLGVTQASVSYWERKDFIPEEHLPAIEKSLGVDRDQLARAGGQADTDPDDPDSRVEAAAEHFYGKALKLLREERGISQYALAIGLDINQSSVSYWERGNLPEDQIPGVTAVLGITERELRAKAGELMRQEAVNSRQRVQIWQDTLLFDNELDPVAKAMLAAFPYFWNDAIKAVIVSPEKYVERAGWVDDYDINKAWEKVLESGYLEPVDSGAGIFKLVFRKG
jgi:transcriptional regulator with XRE-family HTH domain